MRSVWFFNTNEPSQNIRLEMKNVVVSSEQYNEILKRCHPGPYAAFFQNMPANVYRLRGPFRDARQKQFFVLDCTGLQLDDRHKQITDIILNRI